MDEFFFNGAIPPRKDSGKRTTSMLLVYNVFEVEYCDLASSWFLVIVEIVYRYEESEKEVFE